jgi:CheY-like chemotaxis protein
MERRGSADTADSSGFVVPSDPETPPRGLVLVVDDDVAVRELVAATLHRHGFDVICAASALDGLECLFLATPAAIVTDLQMEGMDGVDFCRAVRVFERYDRVPIHVITGAGEGERIAAARLIGNVTVASKPHAITRLPATLLELAG